MTASLRRLRLYIEPRDAWVGLYVAPKAVYVCPLPFVVIRWMRCASWGEGMTMAEPQDSVNTAAAMHVTLNTVRQWAERAVASRTPADQSHAAGYYRAAVDVKAILDRQADES